MNKQGLITCSFVFLLLQTSVNCQRSSPQTPYVDYLDFSVITDSIVRQYSEEFNSMCPHTYMCNVLIDYDVSLFPIGMTIKSPCCGPCNCHNDCLKTLDCCLDILPRLLTSDEVKAKHENPTQCVQAQFKPVLEDRFNSKEAYFMMTKCSSSYPDTTVQENCLKEYSDFNFVNDIPWFLPVTDNVTKITYKSKYCAICNNAAPSDLVFWGVNLGTSSDRDIKIQGLSDVNDLLTTDSQSNVVFKVPRSLVDHGSFIQECDYYIDKCNTTGLWKKYDADMESLCLSYLSSYKQYKNVHCYLCNGFDARAIVEICEDDALGWSPSSYVTLLDFNNLEVRDDKPAVQDNSCPVNQKYDVWKETCRSLNCPETMLLVRNKCQPVLAQLKEVTFDITIRLVPIKGYIDVRIIPTLERAVYDDVDRIVFHLISMELLSSPSFIQIFLKLNETLASHQKQSNLTDDSTYKETIKYIAIRIIIPISMRELQSSKLLIEEITSNIYSLNLDITGGWNTEFADISFELFESNLQSSTTTEDSTWWPYDYSQYRLQTPFTDPSDSLGVLPVSARYLTDSIKPVRLLPFLFCPLVTLSEDEFSIQEGRKSVYLKHKNVDVNTSQVIFSNNDSTIMLCSDDYFSKVHNLSSKASTQHTTYNTEVIVSIVCTAISLLSLLIVFLTYSIFKILRTLPGLNNMGLVMSLFFAQLFYLLGGVVEIQREWLCEVLGLLLHLCLVASFFWMAVCTFHMMKVFAFLSTRTSPENVLSRFIKYSVFVITSSAILVIVNIVTSILDDSSIGYGGQSCYITRKHMVLYTVAIPLGIVIICNLVMFLYVIIKVCRLPEVKKNTKHERQNIIIFAKLSTLTGLTWIFAYIYQWTNITLFAYLFIIANASQGLFIMFAFVINKRVYSMFNASYVSSHWYQMSNKTRTDSENRTPSQAVQNGVSTIQSNAL